MKKMVAGLIAAAVFAGIAQAQSTYSQNAVGFINKDVAKGKLVALTIPFVNMDSEDGSWDFDSTQMAQEAATGSYVYFWNGTAWSPFNKGRGGFTSKHQLKPGEAFFFKPMSDMTVTMAGEVPDDTATPVEVVGSGNLSAIGNPYPVPFDFDGSDLASAASTGAYVYFWNGTAWSPFNKGRGGFTSKHNVEPGEGFFFKTIKSDASKDWEVEKPYEFP